MVFKQKLAILVIFCYNSKDIICRELIFTPITVIGIIMMGCRCRILHLPLFAGTL